MKGSHMKNAKELLEEFTLTRGQYLELSIGSLCEH